MNGTIPDGVSIRNGATIERYCKVGRWDIVSPSLQVQSRCTLDGFIIDRAAGVFSGGSNE